MKRREFVISSTLALGAAVAGPAVFAAGVASQVEYTIGNFYLVKKNHNLIKIFKKDEWFIKKKLSTL